MASQVTCEETIRKVAEEGLEARNLLNFISDGSVEDASKKPPRPQSVSPKPLPVDSGKVESLKSNKRRGQLSRPKSRWRSASAGRNPEKDLRARYWTFLFENLHRAVDEIYQTCEMDESIVESKEAIMMLENYSKEFHALIKYININKDYEKTAPPNRPTSLAWEVRKSSPGKSLLKNVFIEKLTTGNSFAKRILCFDNPNEFASPAEVKNFSQVPGCAEQDISKPRMNVVLETTNPNDGMLKTCCDVTISVVPTVSDEAFPCNQNLIVNQVQCQNGSALLSDSSNIIKSDIKTVPETVLEEPSVRVSDNVDVSPNSLPNAEAQDPSLGHNVEQIEHKCSILNSDTGSNNSVNIHSNELQMKSGNPEARIVGSKNSDILFNSSLKIVNNQSSADETQSSIQDVNQDENFSNQITSTQAVLQVQQMASNDKSSQQITTLDVAKAQVVKKNEKNSKNISPVLSRPLSCSGVSEKKANPKMKSLTNKNIKKTSPGVSASNSSRIIPSDSKVLVKTENGLISKGQSSISLKNEQIVKNVAFKSANSIKLASTESNIQVSKSTDLNTNISKPKLSQRSAIPPAVDKKTLKISYSESAIKRNISYVSSLSSKNQMAKPERNVKKTVSHVVSEGRKLSQKNGSMPSLNKQSNTNTWARKTASVEKIPEQSKLNADDDSDGWETVRGRNRCRNSPAKKIPFAKQNQDNQVAQFAKLNQTRIGGFPYTTKVNGKVNIAKKQDTSKKTADQNPKTVSVKIPNVETEFGNKRCEAYPLSEDISPNAEENKELKGKTEDKRSGNSKDLFQLNCKSTNERSSRREYPQLPSDVVLILEANKTFPENVYKKSLGRSCSAPCSRSGVKGNCSTLSKVLCISDQYLGTQKYVNPFKKKIFDTSVNYAKRRNKKTKAPDDRSIAPGILNGSLDESDNGLTSDDQDGPVSQDEAFDAHCQELWDTAWKYKILEQQVHKLELSWGEQMDRFDMELRTPGRALEMHEKLSSPFRKKSLYESIRVCNEKQIKAQEQRERLLVEKAQKFKIIQRKRQEMKALVEQRQEKQRILMEQKLQRAEEKRKKQLEIIIRKAHDEKEKVNEIAFINTLEAQNKRHDLISKEKDHEARLHDIQEERQRKQEEKAAKEAAAEGRRKVLEAERQARLNEMQEKRKMRDHKVEQLFLVKEKERQELANQKARDRELRLSALNAQQQISIEELQKKIQMKQEESARRHEENMEQIRQKAFELSIRKCSSNNDDVPQPVPYERKKICTICNVLIGSEVYLLSHLHGKKHQEAIKVQHQGQDPSAEELELYNLKHIVDASTDQLDPNIALDKERQKALKKRCKKLRQRMSNRGQEYETQAVKKSESLNSSVKAKMEKIIGDLKKLSLAIEENSSGNNTLNALERNVNDIITIYNKKLHENKSTFKAIGGITAVINLFNIMSHFPMENNVFSFKRILNLLSSTATSIVKDSEDLCSYILFSNKIGNLLDLLIHRLNNLIPDNISQLMLHQTKSNSSSIPYDPTAEKLLQFLTNIFTVLSSKGYSSNGNKENKSSDFQQRMQDVISYIVSIGIVDKLSQFFNCIQGPIDNETEVASFLLDAVAFLTALIRLNSDCVSSTSNHKTDDSTQLIATFRVTNMVGAVSLLYSLLLHNGASSRGEEPPPPLPHLIQLLAFSTLCMLNNMALMSLHAFQSILGSEGLSLQLRHISSHLLWYCSHLTCEPLLHEIILLVGYFTVLNPENQSIIQAGQRPTVLQQLCCLPFLYFSDTELTDILFPTLIACCYKNPANKIILEQEMSSELLSNYVEVKYLSGEESNHDETKNSASMKRWLFSVRFPKCHWSSAKQYFSISSDC